MGREIALEKLPAQDFEVLPNARLLRVRDALSTDNMPFTVLNEAEDTLYNGALERGLARKGPKAQTEAAQKKAPFAQFEL